MFMVNNNPKDKIQGAVLKAMGLVEGASDLIWMYKGKCYAIEMKTATGTQKKEQKKFQAQWESQGGVYVIKRSFEEFCNFVQNIVQ
jgi:hypothetical protein